MTRVAVVAACALPLLVMSSPAGAADEAYLLGVELPAAIPLSSPQRDRFCPGPLPAVAGYRSMGAFVLGGARLRGGALLNGPAPKDAKLADPGLGGLGALTLVGRLRPFADRTQATRARGAWIELGGGVGLTGSLMRPVAEAGLGWTFSKRSLLFGPVVRYLHVVQTGGVDATDAKLALVGLEVTFFDPKPVPPPPPPPLIAKKAPPPPPPPPPPADKDGDGITDDKDKCPDDPEDKDGFEDEDGCPDNDNDKDGIADASDKCPNEAEVVNSFEDEDGCPDKGLIEVLDDRIILEEKVLFDVNRARVKSTARPALEAVLSLWKKNPKWQKLVIEGHADVRGSDRYNDWLSALRSKRVREALVNVGFPGDRLDTKSYGRRKPRDGSGGDDAHQRNRRVEFIIVNKPDEAAAAPVAPAATEEKP